MDLWLDRRSFASYNWYFYAFDSVSVAEIVWRVLGGCWVDFFWEDPTVV
jgi:hypothetical protein